MKILIFVTVCVLVLIYRHKLNDDWLFLRKKPRAWFKAKWKNWGEPLLVAALFAILIRTFVLGPYKIPTGSMRPTFMEGDRIFVDKVSYRFKDPKRGDVIVFKYPVDKKKDFVKRLVGLPGDSIQIREGALIINGEELEYSPFAGRYYYNVTHGQYGQADQIILVPENAYFVLGDNSAHSSDSRHWGFVPQKNIVGRAFLIWWPPNRVKSVK